MSPGRHSAGRERLLVDLGPQLLALRERLQRAPGG
jgi:hypothetical protein